MPSDELREKVAKAIHDNMVYAVKKREAKVFADASLSVVSPHIEQLEALRDQLQMDKTELRLELAAAKAENAKKEQAVSEG